MDGVHALEYHGYWVYTVDGLWLDTPVQYKQH